MPTPVVSADKMAVGKKSGGKHWTQSEVESRQAAAQSVGRKGKVRLKPPDWLDEKALEVWRRTKKAISGMDILDNIDCDMLAIYCDAIARYAEFAQSLVKGEMVDIDGIPRRLKANELTELSKAANAYSRQAAQLAEKLGLTPNARARLAKKKAESPAPDSFADEFG